jgi:hypothetical protein
MGVEMTFDVTPLNGQTWLVCGGRDFADAGMFRSAMADLVRLKGMPARIIHGGAQGADTMAGEYADRHALDLCVERADWRKHGRAAGPIRNQAMLDKHRPALVVAFPGGRGTADMVARARAAGVDVAEIKRKAQRPVDTVKGG